MVFYNGSNYDYQFVIKELTEKFKKQLTCLGESTEIYITFAIPIEKEVTKIDKNGEKNTKNIPYILQFIDAAICMVSSLSNLVNNLSEGLKLNRIKCKFGHDNKLCETCRIKYKYSNCFLEYANFKDGFHSGKTNSSFNLINHQSDIDKIYLHAKDPFEAKFQFSIKKREDVGTKHFNYSKAFIEYSYNKVDFLKKTLTIITQTKDEKY